MGNCNCAIHLHQNDNEARIDNMNRSQENDTSKANEIESQYSQKETKLSKMDSNLEKKLLEFGKFIQTDEFIKKIHEDIYKTIKTQKINVNKYIRNLKTYKSNPIQFNANDDIYWGTWNENCEMEGHGIYYLTEKKIVTEGVWIKGNIIYGRIFFITGDIYEGEIKNSLPDGNGQIEFANGELYKGDFKQGEMTGKGKFIFSDNTEYNGGIENGIFNGKGKMKWENGTEYDGDFTDSSLTGRGEITNMQNEKYKGEFDKNEFNGEGTYFYNNGDEYEGSFEYGIKRGKGIYRRNDKVVFDGQWNDDLPNGNGVLSFEGNKLKGFWRNGILIGNSEIEEGNIENFNGIDTDIKPNKITIFPSSLSHLSISDSSVSQFVQGNFI